MLLQTCMRCKVPTCHQSTHNGTVQGMFGPTNHAFIARQWWPTVASSWKGFLKKNDDLIDIFKIGWRHGIFITFNISQILNIILGIKGGCGNEHSKGMATMRKLGMAPRRYNGASHGSMDTLKSRIMRQRSGWSGWEVLKEEKNPKC